MTDTDSIEPKPCPFCGKTNAKRHCNHASGWIGCECGASGPMINLDVDRYPGDSFRPNEEQKVVSAWNRRALSARASAGEAVEIIEDAIKLASDGVTFGCPADVADWMRDALVAAPQPAQAGASGGGEVVELRICEVPHLMLRRDQLYRFTVDPNCEACRDAAAFGTAPASPATVDWEQAVVAACMRVESCLAKDDPATTLRNLEQWWYQLGVETTANGFLVEQANATPASPATDRCTCPSETRCAGTCPYYLRLHTTPPAHGDGEGDDDEATEPTELQIEYARGYGDGIRDAEKIAAARPTPEAQEARDEHG